ncbi:hypothetical protein OAA83_00585 [Candidatus Marinimicrobia bacterium]|jgi:hypothetical protein|nr:hypothetical protein [Candidatus Neomarinimicrobiota bacterium]|tara:strand:+ start:246 stop:926 length:681 start_codon:yes stop_codon:yes gene_type:complete
MKNILARGGIEFIAVLLGITGSLWVDESRQEKEKEKQLQSDIIAIHNELLSDIVMIDSNLIYNQKMYNDVINLLSIMEKTKINQEALDTIPFFNRGIETRSYFGKKSAYLSAKSGGNLNRFNSNQAIQEMSKLYDNAYARMEMVNVAIDDFLYRDSKYRWYAGYESRGFIYDKDDFEKKINSSEFYDWASATSTLLKSLIDIMKVTKSKMLLVESLLIKMIDKNIE